MAKTQYFTPDLYRFLKDLREHNDRAWFAEHKHRYEAAVREPLLRFIADFGPKLKIIAPHFVADPSPVGGSMMRIYRDTRFAKDKSPFKTAATAQFQHGKGKDGMTPAFYLHLEPGNSAIGAGMWRPLPPALKRIRDAIVGRTREWAKVREGRELRDACAMIGESLKRPPPGYDPNHPFVGDLKRKDFAMSVRLDEHEIGAPGFMDVAVEGVRKVVPFVRFLSEALGLEL
jgi:uncharacterized protein (TIGR02453 family)